MAKRRLSDLEDINGARQAPLPDKIKPSLATLVDEAPAGDDWLHEVKFDGYRILARIEDGRVRLSAGMRSTGRPASKRSGPN